MADQNRWLELTESNPGHSAWYIKRFEDMAAEGNDLDGEARLVHALSPRGGRILDAGCGPGRVAAHLAELGHDVVGVDLDPELIEAAENASSKVTWLTADLSTLDLPAAGIAEGFDVIFSAGNVVTFLATNTRTAVMENLARNLNDRGRLVIGFGGGRGYEFDDFYADAAAAGLESSLKLSTWDMRPFTSDSNFLVAVLTKA